MSSVYSTTQNPIVVKRVRLNLAYACHTISVDAGALLLLKDAAVLISVICTCRSRYFVGVASITVRTSSRDGFCFLSMSSFFFS